MVRLLKIDEVIAATGVPRSSIYWRSKFQDFPKPVKIGERSSAWRSDEIEQWIAGRVAASRPAVSRG